MSVGDQCRSWVLGPMLQWPGEHWVVLFYFRWFRNRLMEILGFALTVWQGPLSHIFTMSTMAANGVAVLGSRLYPQRLFWFILYGAGRIREAPELWVLSRQGLFITVPISCHCLVEFQLRGCLFPSRRQRAGGEEGDGYTRTRRWLYRIHATRLGLYFSDNHLYPFVYSTYLFILFVLAHTGIHFRRRDMHLPVHARTRMNRHPNFDGWTLFVILGRKPIMHTTFKHILRHYEERRGQRILRISGNRHHKTQVYLLWYSWYTMLYHDVVWPWPGGTHLWPPSPGSANPSRGEGIMKWCYMVLWVVHDVSMPFCFPPKWV